MDRQQAIARLKELQGSLQDVEIAHVEADQILCDLLNSLGYMDVVDQWIEIEKWYA